LETNDIGINSFEMNAMYLQQATTHGVLKNSLCNNSNFELCSNTFVTFFKKMNAFVIEHIIKKLFIDWAINDEVFSSSIQRLA
jgi:hypothetical protein